MEIKKIIKIRWTERGMGEIIVAINSACNRQTGGRKAERCV